MNGLHGRKVGPPNNRTVILGTLTLVLVSHTFTNAEVDPCTVHEAHLPGNTQGVKNTERVQVADPGAKRRELVLKLVRALHSGTTRSRFRGPPTKGSTQPTAYHLLWVERKLPVVVLELRVV